MECEQSCSLPAGTYDTGADDGGGGGGGGLVFFVVVVVVAGALLVANKKGMLDGMLAKITKGAGSKGADDAGLTDGQVGAEGGSSIYG